MTPTSDKEAVLEKLSRTARALARLGAVTRAICIVMLLLAFCLLMYAFSRADRHTDDFVGFGIISVAVAALALVFWSTAVFHRAFGESLVLLFSMNDHLEALRSQSRSADPVRGRSSSRAASGAVPPAAQALLSFTAPTAGAAPPWTTDAAPPQPASTEPGDTPAPGAAAATPDALGGRAQLKIAVAAAPAGAQGGAAAVGHDAAAAAPAAPPAATKICRHCGGRIKIDALRCRHCFEPV